MGTPKWLDIPDHARATHLWGMGIFPVEIPKECPGMPMGREGPIPTGNAHGQMAS